MGWREGAKGGYSVCVLVVKNCLSSREECSSSDKVITLFYIVYIVREGWCILAVAVVCVCFSHSLHSTTYPFSASGSGWPYRIHRIIGSGGYLMSI